MRITDAAKASKEFRQHRKLVTMHTSIEHRLEYYHRALRYRLTLNHILRATHALKVIKETLGKIQNPSLQLDRDELISRLRDRPTRESLAWIFEGLPPPIGRQRNDYERQLLENLTEAGRQARAAQHEQALLFETAYRAEQGYFMLFNTLTVAAGNYQKIFAEDNKAFQTYIRHFTRLVKGNHTYMAVVEEGSQTGRLHLHVMHFFKQLPEKATDPNKGRDIPNYQELTCFKNLWPYGLSKPIMVRYSTQDAYSKAGYRWPIDPKTGTARRFRSPLAIAGYCSKYILKSYSSEKREKTLWRVRKSHQLGVPVLTELFLPLSQQDLLNLATMDTLKITLNNSIIVPTMMRQQALRHYHQRHHCSENHGPSIHQMAQKCSTRPSLLQSSPDSILSAQMNSLQNIGATRISNTKVEDSYNETLANIAKTEEAINAKYFRKPSGEYGTTTTRDVITQ